MGADVMFWTGFALGVLTMLVCGLVLVAWLGEDETRTMPPSWQKETWKQHEKR